MEHSHTVKIALAHIDVQAARFAQPFKIKISIGCWAGGYVKLRSDR